MEPNHLETASQALLSHRTPNGDNNRVIVGSIPVNNIMLNNIASDVEVPLIRGTSTWDPPPPVCDLLKPFMHIFILF